MYKLLVDSPDPARVRAYNNCYWYKLSCIDTWYEHAQRVEITLSKAWYLITSKVKITRWTRLGILLSGKGEGKGHSPISITEELHF